MPETISWVWYHGQDLGTSAGTKTFFQTNKSAATNGLADTNMVLSGQFPSAEKFVLKKISVVPSPNEDPDDILAALSEAVLQLNIDGKPYLEIPVVEAVKGAGGAASAALYGQASATEIDRYSPGGNGYELGIPITIMGGVSFDVKIKFVNAPSTSCFVYVCLHGERTRPTV